MARKGGLYAEYFNNAFLNGVPTLTKVDNIMNFNWSTGLITPQAGNFISIQWFGKLLAPYSEEFTFILQGDDGFRFYLQGVLLVDRWDTCCDVMQVAIPLVAGQFYDIVIQYKQY